jgi:hypothetical protein
MNNQGVGFSGRGDCERESVNRGQPLKYKIAATRLFCILRADPKRSRKPQAPSFKPKGRKAALED